MNMHCKYLVMAAVAFMCVAVSASAQQVESEKGEQLAKAADEAPQDWQ